MTCADVLDRIDPHADGELLPAETEALDRHVVHCAFCTEELALNQRVLSELRSQRSVACPDHVYREALAVIAREERDRGPRRSARGRVRSRWIVRAASAALVAGATLAIVLLVPRTEGHTYSLEEVAEARQQIELAFALVGDAGRTAGLYLHDDILPNHVLGPLSRSLQPTEL